ncbi:hypothetical protein ACMD2_27395 [Ananas comosus]|uniref:Uncharacterized protein n=1 Tax=Ananas comosus TaxID=4615 RepID=A0A199UJ34_ANACO|nr:hypothetical protein ACMD2_27395 [Ananas comosus]
MEDQEQHQPLLLHHPSQVLAPNSSSSSSSNNKNNSKNSTTNNNKNNTAPFAPTTFARVVTILALAAVTLWANYEASKGFQLTVVPAAARSLPAHRFNLMFVSNGRAARLVLNASNFVERALYPTELFPRKKIYRVTLRLAEENFTNTVSVVSQKACGPKEFTVSVSPSIVAEAEGRRMNELVASAVLRGMAHVWLQDGQGAAPRPLVDGMAEYLLMKSGLPSYHNISAPNYMPRAMCWTDRSYVAVAGFLQFCEDRRRGFVARLNRAMRKRWDDGMVDEALQVPSRRLCSAYLSHH